MTALKEKSHNFGISDDGDVVPLEDFDYKPVDNASIAQGMTNLDENRRLQRLLEADERQQRQLRERKVTDAALNNAGVVISLDEHRQNQRDLVDVAANLSMYKGGEKGGYETTDFIERYGLSAAQVAAGAMRNHKTIVNQIIPKIYRADELKAAGFEPAEVDFDAKTILRNEVMNELGGPTHKKDRAARRARYQ